MKFNKIRILKFSTIIVISIMSILGCKKEDTTFPSEDGLIPFTAAQKNLADKVISCFENNTPTIQYAYIENLNDGRGYTAGKAGFTTANGDLLEVVKKYSILNPQNSLYKFIPILETLADNEDSNVAELTNLPTEWLTNSNNPKFIEAQNYVADFIYYEPAVEACKDNGLKMPISLLCLYDCCIQHGDGDDPDGLYAIIDRTTQAMGGSPNDGKNELDWIIKFNTIRKSVLLNPNNTDTQQEWSESIGRVDVLLKLIQVDKNYGFNQPTFQINPFGTNHTLTL